MPGSPDELNAERQVVRRKRRRRSPPIFPLPDPTREPNTDTVPQIKHIVILMMENHSYDNYLGMLERGDGFERDGTGTPVASNLDLQGNVVPAEPRGSTSQERGLPTQSWHASHVQFNGGKKDGFVVTSQTLLPELPNPKPKAKVGMQYWREDDLPFYYGLARTFPLMDRWFSSCLGPTFPNRRFLIAGTAHGLIDNLPTGIFDYPAGGTIFDRLTEHGIDWANYHHITPFIASRTKAVRVLGKPGLQAIRALGLFAAQIPGLQGYLAGKGGIREYMMHQIQCTANLYPLGWRGARNHLRPLEQFFRDADDGTLPPVAIVDPDFREFSEENPQDISDGEAFAGSVIKAVMNGKGWAHTLLIWTYDEHGGYYDHVAPPYSTPPDDVLGHSLLSVLGAFDWILRRFSLWRKLKEADGDRIFAKLDPRKYDRLGFRVPTVIVSPYARVGYVSSRDGPHDGPPGAGGPRVYDHTSILRTIERKWNLRPLTQRDNAAHDVFDALDLEADPPPFTNPPDLPDPSAWHQ